MDLIGFSEDELSALLADKTEGPTDPDEVPEAPAGRGGGAGTGRVVRAATYDRDPAAKGQGSARKRHARYPARTSHHYRAATVAFNRIRADNIASGSGSRWNCIGGKGELGSHSVIVERCYVHETCGRFADHGRAVGWSQRKQRGGAWAWWIPPASRFPRASWFPRASRFWRRLRVFQRSPGPGPTPGGKGWSTGNRQSTSSANRTTGTTVPTRMDTIRTFRAVARSGIG
jgi:hypothetical protein